MWQLIFKSIDYGGKHHSFLGVTNFSFIYFIFNYFRRKFSAKNQLQIIETKNLIVIQWGCGITGQ